MAKAWHAPRSAYRRRWEVSAHALQRFRERGGGDLATARPDGDVGNLLDEAVTVGRPEALRFETSTGLTFLAVPLQHAGADLFAVLRGDVVRTVLTAGMVQENERIGRWRRIL